MRFGPKEVIQWFEQKGVNIKKEADGRMFPVSNSSQTIIDCFRKEADKLMVELRTSERMQSFSFQNGHWYVLLDNNEQLRCKKLVLTTGNDKHIWNQLKDMGLQMIEPVPSLFTFNIPDAELHELSGVSFPLIKVSTNQREISGPGLITHWGLSGPAVLKLSAWGALELADLNYTFKINVDWMPHVSKADITNELKNSQQADPRKKVTNTIPLDLTKRFWEYICKKSEVREFQNWSETGKKHILRMVDNLKEMPFEVTGKSTFKEEFVTAGGIDLNEINPETFEIKKFPGLYAAGEILNIDAVTGGFNFQAAWTGAWHISQNL